MSTPPTPTAGDLRNDPRSAEELFAASLKGDDDDQAAWDAIVALRLRGTPEIFELAKSKIGSTDPRVRSRALDVLAQLGAGKPDSERPYKAEATDIALHS